VVELPLALSGLALALVFVVVPAVALLGYGAYTRLLGPRFVDCHTTLVVAESPAMAIGRVLSTVEQAPHYTFRRVGWTRLEVIHGTAFPGEDAERPLPEVSNVILDLLVVTAEPVATGTEVHLVGRAEPWLIARIRQQLRAAPQPAADPDRG
jgi:hypothetical protein